MGRFLVAAMLVAGVVSLTAIGTMAAAQAPAAAQSRDSAGRALFTHTCSQCHSIGLVTAQGHSRDEWNDILHRMVGLGAPVDAGQAGVIVDYLATHFAVAGASPADVADAAAAAQNDSGPRFPRPQGPDQWPAYGGSNANRNYSPLKRITRQNVARLKQAWVYHYGAGSADDGDEGIDYRFEVTPLVIGGVMYISTPAAPRNPALKASVTALRPETGEVIWRYESPLNIHGRGLAYWPGDGQTSPRLIFGTDGGFLMAVDVTTGRLARGFGRNGRIDAYVGVASELIGDTKRHSFTIPNPAIVYRNLIITGARPGETGPPGPRGDIRAWDAVTGRLVWTFHVVPQPGEPGHETYMGDEWRDVSGANVWSTMSLDDANGILYAPTGDLNSNVRGPHLYGNSVLALDAATGRLKWFRQITHRDIWDWDLPTPLVLLDVTRQGRKVPAVLVTGKHGLLFLFNRLTGEPLNGFDERPIPQPEVASDEVWPTEPFPTAPAPLARTQMTRAEIPDLAPGMRAYCTKFWDDNHIVSPPLYSPRASVSHGVLSYPSATGGPNWGGGAYDPGRGLYFINLQNIPTFHAAVGTGSSLAAIDRNIDFSMRHTVGTPTRHRRMPPFSFPLEQGGYLPCAATPWGELVAVDLERLSVAWRVPLGTVDALGAKAPPTGAPNLGGSIVTASGVIFIGASNDRRFRAFDARTGKKLWEAELEASAHATPITYLGTDGKQYVVVAAAGGTSAGGLHLSDTLVAFVLK